MDNYGFLTEVTIGKELLLDSGASNSLLKSELCESFYELGDESCISTIIDNMTNSFSDKNQREAFSKMLQGDFFPYMDFVNINRNTCDIELHEDPDFCRISFEFEFDHEKAMKKAEKAFKQLNQELSR